MTSKQIVYGMLKSRRWTLGVDLEAEAGAGALRRVRELRSSYEIKTRRNADGHFEYRLVGRA